MVKKIWTLLVIFFFLAFSFYSAQNVAGLRVKSNTTNSLTIGITSQTNVSIATGIVYSNYSNVTNNSTINGIDVYCQFSHNKKGLWIFRVNLTSNYTLRYPVLIADGGYKGNNTDYLPIGNYSHNISCYNTIENMNLTVNDTLLIQNYFTSLGGFLGSIEEGTRQGKPYLDIDLRILEEDVLGTYQKRVMSQKPSATIFDYINNYSKEMILIFLLTIAVYTFIINLYNLKFVLNPLIKRYLFKKDFERTCWLMIS